MTESSYAYETLGTQSELPNSQCVPNPLLSTPLDSLHHIASADIWHLIFRWLDLRSVPNVVCVSSKWRSTCILFSIYTSAFERELDRSQLLAERIETLAKMQTQHSNREIAAVAHSIVDTTSKLKTLSNMPPSLSVTLSSEMFICMMLHSHVKLLEITEWIFSQKAPSEVEWMTINMELHRSWAQLERTFKIGSTNPSEIQLWSTRVIVERDAREKWRSMMQVRKRIWLSVSELFSELRWPKDWYELFRDIIDFPRDGMITPWKWNAFVNMLGPWRDLRANFERFVIGGGFIGYVSREFCERLLRHLPEKTVILRGSLRHPSTLAMSYRPFGDDKCAHLTNNPNFWTMEDFGPTLEQIAKESGQRISARSNVPTAWFVLMFEKNGYQVSGVQLPPLSHRAPNRFLTPPSDRNIAGPPNSYVHIDVPEGYDQPTHLV